MADPIDFPDAAKLIANHLAAEFDVPVVDAEPNPRPARFVQIERAGGSLRTFVSDRARIVFYGWGEDDQDAAALCQQARSHILAMRGLVVSDVQVYRTEDLQGPSRDPDPDSGAHRYSGTAAVALRGSTLTGS